MTRWLASDLAWWLLALTGVLLRLRQYTANRSLWADEASLAYNLANRSFAELTGLLDYHQAAPIGFLFIEKFFVVTLGNYDYVMRLFPLLSGILATVLVYRIAREHFGWAGLLALAMFAIGYFLVYYASELKQYSSDVMAAVLLVYLAGRCLREEAQGRDFSWLGAAGVVIIWVSHPSVFILAGVGLALLLDTLTRKGRAPLAWLVGMGLAWLASFGLEYFVSLRHIVADGYLIEYWRKAYMPMPPWSEPGWFVKIYTSFLYISLHTHWAMSAIFLLLAPIGALSLWARQRSLALILTLPFLVTLAASALQKYPLMQRFILFLAPLALFLMAEGLGRIYRLVAKWNRALALVACGLPVAVMFGLVAPLTFSSFLEPVKASDIKPVLAYLAENKQPDDTVYVFHGADPAFNYYAPFYGLEAGNNIIGFDTTRRKVALKRFYEDVEALRGTERVWFLFSDIVDCGGCEGNMQAFYVDYLDQFGMMLDSFGASGANAYLYDLRP
ncbi:MAG: glycosyltransferase family 39 protein [Chloroflexota bacterium]